LSKIPSYIVFRKVITQPARYTESIFGHRGATSSASTRRKMIIEHAESESVQEAEKRNKGLPRDSDRGRSRRGSVHAARQIQGSPERIAKVPSTRDWSTDRYDEGFRNLK
jgi:hypothetical protein